MNLSLFVGPMLAFALVALTLTELPPLEPGHVRVVLIRHGQAFTNLENPPLLPPDQLDRLTDLGKEQVRAAGAELGTWKVAKVVSSPAGRAQETSALLTHVLGLEKARVDERIGPMRIGTSADGGEIDFAIRVEAWKNGEDPRPFGGESMDDLGKRVMALSRELAKSYTGKTIVLIAHSEVIAAFLGEVDGVAPAKRFPWKIANGSLSVVDVGTKTATVRQSNVSP